jgi:pSer/pThr/pTyr-binding forkhead associated (FHA) protein
VLVLFHKINPRNVTRHHFSLCGVETPHSAPEDMIDTSGLPLATAAPLAAAAKATLQITKDGVALGSIPLHREVTVLGRNSGMAHIVLEHQSVSRRHAAIAHGESGGVFVIDLGSVHGTFIRRTGRIAAKQAVQLQEGDSLKFGDSSRSYTVHLPSAGQTVAARSAEDAVSAEDARPAAAAAAAAADSADAAAASDPAADRARRRAEIDAMTAQMLSSAPTYTRSAEAVAVEAAANAESDEDSDEDDDDDVAGPPAPALTPEERARRTAQRLELPVSHEAALKGHSKAVIALSVDPGGGRVASGGSDYKVKLYDFGGMDKHHRSFREFEAEEGNIVVALSHSPSGDRFLCCTASAQPKVFDRDGIEVCHFARGDPYIRDMKQTKGHITNVTAGQWHPSEKNTVRTVHSQ